MKHITPENELLLLCTRSRLNDALLKHARLLVQNNIIDWEVLLKAAARHRVLPLQYINLKSCCRDLVPDDILQQLKSFFLNNAGHNLLLAGTLRKILKLVAEHDIQAVPFKGPLLTDSVYGDLSLRSFGDLDILIAQQDMEPAVRLLLQQGYTTNFDLPLKKYLKLVRNGHHANLVNHKNGLVIELHWEMTGRYCMRKLELDYVRPRLESATLLDRPVVSLGAEDLLLYLCVHGNRHRWEQLDAVCCIAELIRQRPAIDWDLTLKIAEELGAVRMLLLGLVLARDLLGSILPATVMKIVGDKQELTSLAAQIERELLDPTTAKQEVMYHLSGVTFHYRTMDHLSGGIMYGIRKFCTLDAYDLEWLPLPTSLWFLYPALRPLRFAAKHGQRLFGKKIAAQKE